MKTFKKTEIIIVILIIIYLIITTIIYPHLPDTIATHWNSKGVADGFSPKLIGVLIMPLFFLFVLGTYSFLSRTNYLKTKDMKKQLSTTMLVSVLFLFYVSILSLAYNLGYNFNMNFFITIATSVLIIAIGIILKKIKKRNFFFGIRTPWTLLDQEVWEKTHIFGGKVFIVSGILLLVCVFFVKNYILIFLSVLFVMLITIFLYSYYVFKQKIISKKN